MSAAASPAPHAPAATGRRVWRVRTDKGDVFGPADMETLKTWARDGRLAPTNELSEDGREWLPVTSFVELEMDWVVQVNSGSFYGPIHLDALAELVREGSISAASPVFRRATPGATVASEREQQLETRLHELQQQLYARIGDLDAQLATARGDAEQSRSFVSAKDLEFDAERQEQRASLARAQAELVKRDGRLAVLEKEVARLEAHARERAALEPRVAELERQAAAAARQAEEARLQAEQARAAQRDLERTAAPLRERLAEREREADGLREAVRGLRLRAESVRKLLQQAAAAAGAAEDVETAEVIEARPVTAPRVGAPPPASPASGAKPAVSLAELEAQAQRELRQLGGKGAAFLKGRAKG
jgi:hypothetical protein